MWRRLFTICLLAGWFLACSASPAQARRAPDRLPLGRETPTSARKYVFTGGPGVGKTTLINALVERGYIQVPEVPRQVIKREQRKEQRLGRRGVLPWNDLVQFEREVVKVQTAWERRAQRQAGRAGRGGAPGAHGDTVLDRSLVDPIAYLVEAGITPSKSPELYSSLFSRIRQAGYTKVFFLDRLPTYVNDAQRTESEAQAEQIHRRLFQVYKDAGRRYGFSVVQVPVLSSIPERIDYVLRRMK